MTPPEQTDRAAPSARSAAPRARPGPMRTRSRPPLGRGATLLLLLLLAPLLLGSRLLRDPIEIRIEGYLGASEEEVNPWAMLDVWLAEPPDRKLAVMNIIVLSPGAVSGGDILAAMRPIRPNIIFNGDREQLDEIASAQPNQLLKIVGYTVDGPRRILIRSVERSAPITGPTATPTLREKILGF